MLSVSPKTLSVSCKNGKYYRDVLCLVTSMVERCYSGSGLRMQEPSSAEAFGRVTIGPSDFTCGVPRLFELMPRTFGSCARVWP